MTLTAEGNRPLKTLTKTHRNKNTHTNRHFKNVVHQDKVRLEVRCEHYRLSQPLQLWPTRTLFDFSSSRVVIIHGSSVDICSKCDLWHSTCDLSIQGYSILESIFTSSSRVERGRGRDVEQDKSNCSLKDKSESWSNSSLLKKKKKV